MVFEKENCLVFLDFSAGEIIAHSLGGIFFISTVDEQLQLTAQLLTDFFDWGNLP